MVSSIIGAYLVEKGLLTGEELTDVMREQDKVRVKLGLIAVSEGLMTQQKADEINQLQATMDKRFGDLAVEKGYLTEDQVEGLLKKQGNAYMAFAQVLSDKGIMDINRLEQCLVEYKQSRNFSSSDIETIKSNEPDRILPLFMPAGAEPYFEMAGVCVRTIIRFIDSDVFPEKASIGSRVDANNAALQFLDGNPNVMAGFCGMGNALLPMACKFGMAEFDNMNEEAIDAVSEFTNCINGLYACAVGERGIKLELLPPEYATDCAEVKGEQFLILPLHIKGEVVNFLVSLNHKMEIK